VTPDPRQLAEARRLGRVWRDIADEHLARAKAAEADRDRLAEALRKIDQPGRPEPERGIARAALASMEGGE